MQTKQIIYLLLALVAGLAAGYFLFGGTSDNRQEAHQHGESSSDKAGAKSTIWTCSMHPQIQQDEPGDCPLCGMELIPLASGNATDPSVLTMTEAAIAMARVRTFKVGATLPEKIEDGDFKVAMQQREAMIQLSGRLAPDERTTSIEVSEYGGRVERLFVSFPGQQVKAGQRIATIYSPDIVVAQEEFLQALAFEEVNPAVVAAARSKLSNLEVTDEQIARLEQSGEVIKDFPVFADEAGTILSMQREVGQYIQPGAALYTYTDLDQLWALFDAYEKDLARIRVGDKITIEVPSLPGQTFGARVSFIDPIIDPQTRTAAVRAEINNRSGRLKPQMFINGSIELSSAAKKGRGAEQDEALIVPKTAVLWTGPRSVVYVELPDTEVPTYQFREVALGERTDNGYRILDGLEAGESVVINGVFQIDAAAQLNNKASMINRDVLIAGRAPEATTTMDIPDYHQETPEQFRKQLGAVVSAYLPIKDELVATNLVGEALIKPLQTAIAAVDMSLVKGEAHRYWMAQLEAMEAHLEQLASGADVAAQRQQFYFLSQSLINALTAFGVSGEYYVQYCPMAFENTGASWLSNEQQIRNPYFGDLMLKCGSVTAEL